MMECREREFSICPNIQCDGMWKSSKYRRVIECKEWRNVDLWNGERECKE